MDRKRAYTTFSPPLKFYLKEAKLTFDEIAEKMEKAFNSEDEVLVPRGRSLLSAMAVDNLILKGHATHIFMPDLSFCNWLVSCVPSLEREHARVFDQIIKNNAWCIHFPTASRKSSLGFCVPRKCIDALDSPEYSSLFMSFSLGNDEGLAFFHAWLGKETITNGRRDEAGFWYAKLVVGLGMYLSCFPDQIKPGIPDDLRHPNHFKGIQARTIGISEKVVMRDGPTPHYRVGHFRFLESERYKNKKGQAVFVHGCFVKGKAETVLALS